MCSITGLRLTLPKDYPKRDTSMSLGLLDHIPYIMTDNVYVCHSKDDQCHKGHIRVIGVTIPVLGVDISHTIHYDRLCVCVPSLGYG